MYARAVYRFARLGVRHSHLTTQTRKTTLPLLHQMARNHEPIAVLTAHDSISARIAEAAGVDVVLVGDSLAMVAMGFQDTGEITLDEMVYHCRAVRRGCRHPFIVADLPFGSYEQSPEQAMESAVKMMKVGGAQCVKFEGGRELVPTVKKLSSFGIPTMPHIGLTPQRHVATGGFKVQGRSAAAAFELLQDAKALAGAGAQMLLVEGVPAKVSEIITAQAGIPVIGIGAGPHTSGQVLVQLDMLGGFDEFKPKFLKQYANLLDYSTSAVKNYVSDVKKAAFPAAEHCYSIRDDEFQQFLEMAQSKQA